MGSNFTKSGGETLLTLSLIFSCVRAIQDHKKLHAHSVLRSGPSGFAQLENEMKLVLSIRML